MTVRVGINGFGRIGRQVLKAIREDYPEELEVVAVNDLYDPKTNAHLFKYDSNYGIYQGSVEVVEGDLVVDGDRVKVFAERDPRNLPWGDLGVEIVVEGTGVFRAGKSDPDAGVIGADAHIVSGGAKKVIISAPGGKDVDATIVYGVNHQLMKASDTVISNAS